MKNVSRRGWLYKVMAASTALMLGPVVTMAAYPDRPVTIIVPFPAGGPSDTNARRLAPGLSEALGTNVIVENVAGATGAIGAKRVANGAADGYTLLYGSPNEVILAPVLNTAVTYSSGDFRLVGVGSASALALIGRPTLEVDGIDALVERGKAAKEPMSFASVGIGSLQHLAGERVRVVSGMNLLHVPYRGAAPAVNDLLGGQVDLAVLSLSGGTLELIKAGRVKHYGLLASKPDSSAPDLALINAGSTIKGLEMDAWSGLFAPAGTPQDVMERLNDALQVVLQRPEVQASLITAGSRVPEPLDVQATDRFFAQQVEQLTQTASTISMEK